MGGNGRRGRTSEVCVVSSLQGGGRVGEPLGVGMGAAAPMDDGGGEGVRFLEGLEKVEREVCLCWFRVYSKVRDGWVVYRVLLRYPFLNAVSLAQIREPDAYARICPADRMSRDQVSSSLQVSWM